MPWAEWYRSAARASTAALVCASARPKRFAAAESVEPDMVSKARRNAHVGGYSNVEFRLGEIERLPVADGTVDVILSNCVVNLSPDKESVFREAFRVLRPNGRLAISDVVAVKPLPHRAIGDADTYCGCVGGAALVADVEPDSAQFIRTWFPGSGYEEFVRSASITAVKK